MQLRIASLIGILCMALMVTACDGAGAPPTAGTSATSAPTTAATPGGGGGRGANVTPGAQRPANVTPGGQRPGGAQGGQAQRTPQAQATPGSAGAAPTAVVAAVQTPAGNTVPTAVPIPAIPIPTLRAPRTVATATPGGSVAATPVPLPRLPTSQPLPTTAPAVARESLRGKIVFFSDRSGYPQLYVMEADGSNQQLCHCTEALEGMVDQEVTSPDGDQYLYVKQMGGRGGDYQIWAHRNSSNTDVPITGGPPGFPGVDYDPAWSPNARYIAWVSQVNGRDEIYLHDIVENSDVRLTESRVEWYKRPTFSPDGSQIAFWTNKEIAERKQIWVMNLDGSGAHNISQSVFNDYDPIWVK